MSRPPLFYLCSLLWNTLANLGSIFHQQWQQRLIRYQLKFWNFYLNVFHEKKKGWSSVLGSFQQFSSSACSEVETSLSSFAVCMWQRYCLFQKFLSICTAFPHVKSFTLLLFSCVFPFVLSTARQHLWKVCPALIKNEVKIQELP